MKRILYFIAALTVIVDLMYGFTNNDMVHAFVGFKMGIWVHRLILLSLLLIVAWNYYQMEKSKSINFGNG